MKLVIGIFGLLLASLGCGDDDEAPTSPTLDRLNVQGFPLAVGNNWVYEVNGSIASPDSSSDSNYTWKVTADWEIVAKDTVLSNGEIWFAMQGDTLRSVASRNTGGLELYGQLFKAVAQDEEEQPDEWDIISLIFPLEEGKSWTFLFDNDRKSVVKRGERIVVPAGEFDTFLVARNIENDAWVEFRTEQWFSEVGLVKLRHSDTFVLTLTGERGEDLGSREVSTTVEMELQSYSIP